MTQQPSFQPSLPRRSKSSLISLICGILVCIPLVTGLLAIFFGLVGMIRTRNPMKFGRWMAVIGLVLGCINVLVWGGVGLTAGGAWGIWKMTEGPRISAQDFLHAIAAGDDTGAKADTVYMSNDAYDAIAKQIRDQGNFVDTTFTSTNISNDSAHISGTADFDKGTVHSTANISADLQKVAGHWRVKTMTVTP